MATRLEELREKELELLREAFARATQRILAWRSTRNHSDSWSDYGDGSTRVDVDSYGGFGGLDRRVWGLADHGGRALLLVEKAERDKMACAVDLGVFCFGLERPERQMFHNAGTYVQSIELDDFTGEELPLDQLMMATEALDRLYTPEHISTFD